MPELTIDSMIHSIAKTHGINWNEAQEYTALQYYKIVIFENIENKTLENAD